MLLLAYALKVSLNKVYIKAHKTHHYMRHTIFKFFWGVAPGDLGGGVRKLMQAVHPRKSAPGLWCLFLFLQVKLQKHQAFEAEISAHTNTIITIKATGEQMISEEHYESVTIKV